MDYDIISRTEKSWVNLPLGKRDELLNKLNSDNMFRTEVMILKNFNSLHQTMKDRLKDFFLFGKIFNETKLNMNGIKKCDMCNKRALYEHQYSYESRPSYYCDTHYNGCESCHSLGLNENHVFILE